MYQLRTLVAIVLFGVVAISNAATITHYNIDFSSPTHTVGSLPTTGSSSDTVSSINFGNPVVASSFGFLSVQPLVFNADSAGIFDQIGLNLGLGYDNYQVSFDLETANLVNSDYVFAILFDTPSVQNLIFHSDNGVTTFNAAPTPPPGGGTLGPFSDNNLMHVNIDVDLVNNLWTLNVGSLPTFTDTFYATDNDVNSIRFSLSNLIFNSPADPSISAGIDNIVVTSTVVPVPAAVWLFGSGLLGLLGLSRAGIRKE